jgi:hypothetical protein
LAQQCLGVAGFAGIKTVDRTISNPDNPFIRHVRAWCIQGNKFHFKNFLICGISHGGGPNETQQFSSSGIVGISIWLSFSSSFAVQYGAGAEAGAEKGGKGARGRRYRRRI